MVLRNIVRIDPAKCNGCGQCVTACAEGAIELIDGKARLVSEVYCDGLGACLGTCPQGAITVEQRQAAAFDEHAVAAREKQKAEAEKSHTEPCGCPGSRAMKLTHAKPAPTPKSQAGADAPSASELGHWPVQLMLVSPQAEYFKQCDLLIAADCVPFAMADFHQRFLSGRSVVVGCPKLDDAEYYTDKLAAIFSAGQPRSVTVVHMEVPCCRRLSQIVKEAMGRSGGTMEFHDVTISVHGEIQAGRSRQFP
jgi:ferredoxin